MNDELVIIVPSGNDFPLADSAFVDQAQSFLFLNMFNNPSNYIGSIANSR